MNPSPSPRHSNWDKSDRRRRLPADWSKIRKRVLRRDRLECQWRASRGSDICGDHATDVDHIRRGDDHRESNLQSLCSRHHRQKSSQEGAAALSAKRTKIAASFRTTESHPGLI